VPVAREPIQGRPSGVIVRVIVIVIVVVVVGS